MRRSWLFALAGSTLAVSTAPADVVTLPSIRDNTLYEQATGTLSDGAGESFFAGRTGRGDIRRGLIAFDVSVIPPGSTITGVSLTLQMTRTTSGPRTVSLHRALADWGEAGSTAGPQGGGGGASQPGDATWVHRFYPSTFWASAGGDFAPAASASTVVDNLATYSWSGPGLAADVQFWLASPTQNFGWLLKGDESVSRTSKRFASRENLDPGLHPVLEVTYTPAPGIGACCLTDGSCTYASPAQCAKQGGVYRGDGVICSPTPCPNALGACCLPGDVCQVMLQSACVAQSGVFRGHQTTCENNPCAPPIGACCLSGGECFIQTPSLCAALGGVYRGNGTDCGAISCPLVLQPFVNLLPVPSVALPTVGLPGGAASYTITVNEFDHTYHRDLPPTRVWGYNSRLPGPTIEAATGQPVTVTWQSDLRTPQGALRTQHYLPVDLCMHGPNMFGPSPRTVVHLHGGHVPAASDGYPEDTILPGQQQTFLFPNQQPPATLWYHDHALGITRLNVYMGLAGAYIIRDPFEATLGLPSGQYDIPLVIMDRSFNPDGTLRYPAEWREDYFGDFIVVNGKVSPLAYVNRGKYRYRLVNASNARTYTLALSNGGAFHQIGTDGGLLPAPLAMTSLTLMPGERADIVIDFAMFPANSEIILTNSAPAPYPGEPGEGVVPFVMKFVVTTTPGFTGPLPTSLRPVPRIPVESAAVSRDFILRKMPHACSGEMWAINGMHWDHITERPRLGTTEIWRFINDSMMSHPMHMHLVQFQVLDRQEFMMMGGQVMPMGEPVPPEPNEMGWKDTVRSDPMQITRVIARFDGYLGKFAYHCHILEHEDHEMMRQFETTCYANCDASTAAPVLNVADFTCFLQSFAGGNPYANCDGSTSAPTLNVADFTCFLQRYAAGCE